ncbi:GIY-YIG nuclease family protein [Arthrobacter sp. PAMC25284]|uniref:GIY-YIG nuclease family protein n=1 Tax=Arthrobacter sp. PAMC25284 TaxID=2861279 RepID=UPI001C626CD6|nr:hypothetical protein [Arthrobacter sp. PAMC25284]QYF90479.1 hypothetical protein KY499_03995 [Arthrobacter sp. PAMC25284]
MSTAAIAAQLGVHYSTVANDLAAVRPRRVPRIDSPVSSPPQNLPTSDTSATGTWSGLAQCENAWAATMNQPGIYRWFLDGPLPEPFNWPAHLSPLGLGDLLYVGKATNLRTRAKHHKLPTAGSTLRRTLASLMGFPGVWHGKSAHPRIAEEHNAFLTDWMTNNLLMSFRGLQEHETLESAEVLLRKQSKAPLNKDAMTPEQLHASEVGRRWKASAIRL